MERSLLQEFCGRTPAQQARLNLDKARQKTTVLKYASIFENNYWSFLTVTKKITYMISSAV
jgi:hypothetical protein